MKELDVGNEDYCLKNFEIGEESHSSSSWMWILGEEEAKWRA